MEIAGSMDTDQTDIDLIERYLLGKLTDAEEEIFENRLASDREFARKYRLRMTFPELMNVSADELPEKIAEKLPVAKADGDAATLFKPVRFRWAAGVFALVLIVAFAGVILFNRHGGKAKPVEAGPPPDTTPAPASTPAREGEVSEFPGTTLPNGIGLVNPAVDKIISRNEEILFNWNQETDSFSNFYIFSETRERLIIWKGIRPGVREYKTPPLFFQPGKYYWFVGTREVKRAFTIVPAPNP